MRDEPERAFGELTQAITGNDRLRRAAFEHWLYAGEDFGRFERQAHPLVFRNGTHEYT